MSGLHAHVAGVIGEPHGEASCDCVEGLGGAQVSAGGRDCGDRYRLGGVVGPLAGSKIAEATADHGWPAVVRRAVELITRTQGVADARGKQDAAPAVDLGSGWLHRDSLGSSPVGVVCTSMHEGTDTSRSALVAAAPSSALCDWTGLKSSESRAECPSQAQDREQGEGGLQGGKPGDCP